MFYFYYANSVLWNAFFGLIILRYPIGLKVMRKSKGYYQMLDTCFGDQRLPNESHLSRLSLPEVWVKLTSQRITVTGEHFKNTVTTALSVKGVDTRYLERLTWSGISAQKQEN